MTTSVALSTLAEINAYLSESACRSLNGKDREILSQAARRLTMAVREDGHAWQQANWILNFLDTVFFGSEAQREGRRQQVLLKGEALGRHLSGLGERRPAMMQ